RAGQTNVLYRPTHRRPVLDCRRPLQFIGERQGIILESELELARLRPRLDLANGFGEWCSLRWNRSDSFQSTCEERFHFFLTIHFDPTRKIFQHLDDDRGLMASCRNRLPASIKSCR